MVAVAGGILSLILVPVHVSRPGRALPAGRAGRRRSARAIASRRPWHGPHGHPRRPASTEPFQLRRRFDDDGTEAGPLAPPPWKRRGRWPGRPGNEAGPLARPPWK